MRRKNLSLDFDSALALMQEIYNDIQEQKNTANIMTKKMFAMMKEPEDMTLLGPIIKEQQKILNDCSEKKISLVKLQGAFLKQSGTTGTQESMGKLTLTDEEKELLGSILKDEEIPNNNDKYKLKQ